MDAKYSKFVFYFKKISKHEDDQRGGGYDR